MNNLKILFVLVIWICLVSITHVSIGQEKKTRIFVVSSYHPASFYALTLEDEENV